MQWFQLAGVKRPLRSIGPMFEDGLLTLAAVQAGLGCALMREPLIAQYLESGELIKMFDLPIDDGRDYYLCARSIANCRRRAKTCGSGCAARPMSAGSLKTRRPPAENAV